MTAFGPTLRRIRQAHGVSQSALARLAGIDRDFVVKLEAGTRNPSREVIVVVAIALAASDTERAELFAGAEFMVDTQGRTLDPDVVAYALPLATVDARRGELIRANVRNLIAMNG